MIAKHSDELKEFMPVNGGRYKVIASVLGSLHGKMHFSLLHRENNSAQANKTLPEEEFNNLFRKENGEYVLRLKVDAIHPRTRMIHFTAINKGGVPYPGEHSWPMEICQKLFRPFA